MKTAIIGLLILITVLLGIIAVGSTELNDLVRLKQSEITGLKKQIEQSDKAHLRTLDSTRKASAIREDSMRVSHEKSLKANLQSQREIKKLREIVLIRYESDTARINALVKLYPSFKPN